MKYDAIIIGGGAAGLFCAFHAGRRGRRVLVLEHNAEPGRKILISGGGRCNFTNTQTEPENFLSQNPHFCKSALSRYTPQDFISLVKKHNIQFYEKKLGQLFCRDSSRLIVEMLLLECRNARVEIRTGCRVIDINKSDLFEVKTSQGNFTGSSVVVACGGLSFPKIGATDLGLRVAQRFKLKIVETRPSLVGLVMEGPGYPSLAGVSIDSVVTARGQSFRENILFTHRGLSGPAIIQASNYWQKLEEITIDLLPGIDVTGILMSGSDRGQTPANYLSKYLPQRIARHLADQRLPNKPVKQFTKAEVEKARNVINDWGVRFRTTEGYDRAEVTLGGVSTNELSSRSMEAKKVPGLYFIGEVVDVTGWLGGYNFQWAWASGFAAGTAI